MWPVSRLGHVGQQDLMCCKEVPHVIQVKRYIPSGSKSALDMDGSRLSSLARARPAELRFPCNSNEHGITTAVAELCEGREGERRNAKTVLSD